MSIFSKINLKTEIINITKGLIASIITIIPIFILDQKEKYKNTNLNIESM